MPRRKGSETGVNPNIRAVSHGVVAVTVFTRQIQVAITRLNTDWTHNGVTRASIRFLITLNTAGERIRRVVILAKQTEAVANFPLQPPNTAAA